MVQAVGPEHTNGRTRANLQVPFQTSPGNQKTRKLKKCGSRPPIVLSPNIYKKLNKTQYDWFTGKSQNSKKFSAKFKQNPTTSKIHRVFLNILGVKIPQTVTTNFWGQNNIKNEFSTIKLLRMQIFSKIQQLLKNHYLRGGFLTFLGSKMPPGGRTRIFPAYTL